MRRTARAAARHRAARAHWFSFNLPRVTFPSVHAQLQVAGVVGPSRTGGVARDGLLLLLGAVALAVLALASGSMVRLLGRMEGAR